MRELHGQGEQVQRADGAGEERGLSGHEDIKIKDLLETISEMVNFNIKIKCKLDRRSIHHYKNTPYSVVENQNFLPELGEKLVFKSYTDLRQGLFECMHYFINNDLKKL